MCITRDGFVAAIVLEFSSSRYRMWCRCGESHRRERLTRPAILLGRGVVPIYAFARHRSDAVLFVGRNVCPSILYVFVFPSPRVYALCTHPNIGGQEFP